MRYYDDYLDYTDHSEHATDADRLRLLAYVDGRLVDSWTEPVRGSRWERFAEQFDEERRPAPAPGPPPTPRHVQVLRWLEGLVGGRPCLDALTGDPTPPPGPPAFETPDDEHVHAEVAACLDRVATAYFDTEAQRVLRVALGLLWREAPDVVTGSSSAGRVAAGLFWVVGKANALFVGGLTQQLVQRELWLDQPLSQPGRLVADRLRGVDFHAVPRPHGCPDLTAFARPELLTAQTRRTLLQWRDRAVAEQAAAVLPVEVES